MESENELEKDSPKDSPPLFEPEISPLPEPNQRALDAMGDTASLQTVAGDGAASTDEGTEVRRVDGKWIGADGEELRDSKGRAFDPEIHSLLDGAPRLTRHGTIAVKRGRKKGTKVSRPEAHSFLPPRNDAGEPGTAPSPPHEANSLNTDAMIDRAQQAKETAKVMVSTAESLAKMSIGPKAAFQGEERDAMISAWSAYFETLGDLGLPPWAPPLIVTASWGMRVMSEPEVRAAREESAKKRKKERVESDDTTKTVVVDPVTAQANAHFSETGFL